MTARYWGMAIGFAALGFALMNEAIATAVLSGFCGLVMALADIADRR